MEWIYSNKITTLRSTVIDGKLGVFFGQRLVSNPEVSQHLVSFVGSYLSISSSISSFIYIYLVLCGFHQASIFIDISQLHTILSKWPAAMIREDLVCHDKVTHVAFCEQSVKFYFTHSQSFQSVQFVEPLPISFEPQIHMPMFDCGSKDSRVVEICDAIKNGWTMVCFHPPAWAYVLFSDLGFWQISE